MGNTQPRVLELLVQGLLFCETVNLSLSLEKKTSGGTGKESFTTRPLSSGLLVYISHLFKSRFLGPTLSTAETKPGTVFDKGHSILDSMP